MLATASLRLEPGAGELPFRLFLNGEEVGAALFRPEVEAVVAVVAALPGVRAALQPRQRALARSGPCVVVGRDIGTVILPEADLKIFLTATLATRARRRAAQWRARGIAVDDEAVRTDLQRRDRLETERAVAPLRPAPDALVVWTDHLSEEATCRLVLALVASAGGWHRMGC